MKKFWMVMRLQNFGKFQDRDRLPNFMHPSFYEAKEEATRLCQNHPGSQFALLEATHVAEVKSVVITELNQ